MEQERLVCRVLTVDTISYFTDDKFIDELPYLTLVSLEPYHEKP